MPNNDIIIQLTTAINRIDELERIRQNDKFEAEKLHEENKAEIEAIKSRLVIYDLIAAKWGGMCMLAFGLGTMVWEFPERFKAFFNMKP